MTNIEKIRKIIEDGNRRHTMRKRRNKKMRELDQHTIDMFASLIIEVMKMNGGNTTPGAIDDAAGVVEMVISKAIGLAVVED